MVSLKNIAIVSLASSLSVNGLSFVPAIQPAFEKALSTFKVGNVAQHPLEIVIQTFPDVDEKPVPGDSPIVNCDASLPQILNLQKVVIDPNPPVRGENLTFTATGFISQDIEEGAYVEVDVKYGFIKLIHQTFDLCEQITKVDLECPIKKGTITLTKEVEIPNEVPPGKYIVNARAYTKKDVFITCLTATVDFPPA
ncbi:Phosphatidylglycerol/phosphatidylinositol transfer protein [Scheffersomyces xylosifermentans]|uniref:Phosphatidylglycerol/phosphatidylinositol transfer protein n=1 Tax=Scheffersomyces xylosifermentans TaxID=1304137 RepID=UPI00315C62E8